MVSLRTVLLWIAVAVFGVIAPVLFLLTVAALIGELAIYVWLPLLGVSVVLLVGSINTLQKSIERDQRELPAYESRVLSILKPIALLVSAGFFGFLAVAGTVGLVDAVEVETCTSGSLGDTTFMQCTDERHYWVFGFLPVLLAPLMIAVSSAAVFWRDYVQPRLHPVHGA